MISKQVIISSQHYQSFLEHSVPIFLRVLTETEARFIQEETVQQIRKTILETLHRLPANNYLSQYVKPMLSLMFRLLEVENEENVLICLRIIIELHKQFRPPYSPEVSVIFELFSLNQNTPHDYNILYYNHLLSHTKCVSINQTMITHN